MLTITVTNKDGKVVDSFPVYGTWQGADPFDVQVAVMQARERQQHIGNPSVDAQFADRIRRLLKLQNIEVTKEEK